MVIEPRHLPELSKSNYSKEYLLSCEIDFNDVLPCQIDFLYKRRKAFIETFSTLQKEIYLDFLKAIEKDCLAKSLLFDLPGSTPLIKRRRADKVLVEKLYNQSIELAHITYHSPRLKDCSDEALDIYTRLSLKQYLETSNQGVAGFLLAFLSDSSRSGLWKYHHHQRELKASRSLQLQYVCEVLNLYLSESPLFCPDRITITAPYAISSIINYRDLQDKLEARLCYCFKVLTDVS